MVPSIDLKYLGRPGASIKLIWASAGDAVLSVNFYTQQIFQKGKHCQ